MSNDLQSHMSVGARYAYERARMHWGGLLDANELLNRRAAMLAAISATLAGVSIIALVWAPLDGQITRGLWMAASVSWGAATLATCGQIWAKHRVVLPGNLDWDETVGRLLKPTEQMEALNQEEPEYGKHFTALDAKRTATVAYSDYHHAAVLLEDLNEHRGELLDSAIWKLNLQVVVLAVSLAAPACEAGLAAAGRMLAAWLF